MTRNFIASLIALNVLLWLIFARPGTERSVAPPSPETVRAVRPVAPPRAAGAIIVRTNAFQWQQLESEDYRTYIKRLRTIGCPEETIRDIVIADLEKLMAPRVQAADGPREPPKYWKAEHKDLVSTSETLERESRKQSIDFEKREVIRELLGVDLAAERAKTRGEYDPVAERLSFLSAEKRSKVRMLMEQANQAEVALREKSWLENDELTEPEKKQLREIQSKKDAAIAAELTPEEFEQYSLWYSPSAYHTREALSSLDPSENDFLAVYQIQREFDAQWDGVDESTLAPAQKAEYERSRGDAESRIREYLGDERYQKVQQARDPDFQQAQAAAAQFDLKREVASQVYDFKRALADERAKVQANSTLDPNRREQVLRALSDEAERAVIEVMGPKAYRYYLRSGAGKWIAPR